LEAIKYLVYKYKISKDSEFVNILEAKDYLDRTPFFLGNIKLIVIQKTKDKS
jgi:hypothetical protein